MGLKLSDTVPAITICIGEFLAISKAIVYNPQLWAEYNKYVNLVNNFNENNTSEMKSIYNTIDRNTNLSKFTAFEMDQNLTASFNTVYANWLFNLVGYTEKGETEKLWYRDSTDLDYLKPIESILFGNRDGEYRRCKCFTFFSHLKKFYL